VSLSQKPSELPMKTDHLVMEFAKYLNRDKVEVHLDDLTFVLRLYGYIIDRRKKLIDKRDDLRDYRLLNFKVEPRVP
jgi:hypothetical protein